MNKRRTWWLAGAGVLLLVAFGSLLTPFYAEICEKNAYTGEKECVIHHVVVSLLIYIGQVLEAHAGAITGLATVVLAIITWRLVTLGKDQSETTRAQLRAYLAVVVGSAVFQDDKNKFEAKPAILNNGQTPAYNVRYRIKADILTDSVAIGYTFTEPPDVPKSQSSVGPNENRQMSAILTHNVLASEIEDIKRGKGKAMWVWGVVHYDDVFGNPISLNSASGFRGLPTTATSSGFMTAALASPIEDIMSLFSSWNPVG
jgi:hypothetical protein